MKTIDEITDRIDELERQIDDELNTPTDNPVQQWARLKTYQAMQIALVWVLS